MPEVFDTITDSDGDKVEVSVSGADVYLTLYPEDPMADCGCVRLDAGLRDRFAKAWAEAERRAEQHQSATDA